jgi:hypothetical protein
MRFRGTQSTKMLDREQMLTAVEQVIDLIFGRWRSQILARIELGFSKAARSHPLHKKEQPRYSGRVALGLNLNV